MKAPENMKLDEILHGVMPKDFPRDGLRNIRKTTKLIRDFFQQNPHVWCYDYDERKKLWLPHTSMYVSFDNMYFSREQLILCFNKNQWVAQIELNPESRLEVTTLPNDRRRKRRALYIEHMKVSERMIPEERHLYVGVD